MNNLIIGIGGELGSGKDTAAAMINYIISAGLINASYNEFIIRRKSYELTHADKITHYGDPLKQVVSIMYNIPLEHCYSREHKDNLWYCMKERRYLTEAEASMPQYHKVTIDMLKYTSLAVIIEVVHSKTIVIKLRTLLQYVGTNLCRFNLDKDLWVNATISKAAEIAETKKHCVVPDVRFANENDVIKNHVWGYTLLIDRESSKQGSTHDSEIMNFIPNEIISNNGTLLQLFYKLHKVLSNLLTNGNGK